MQMIKSTNCMIINFALLTYNLESIFVFVHEFVEMWMMHAATAGSWFKSGYCS